MDRDVDGWSVCRSVRALVSPCRLDMDCDGQEWLEGGQCPVDLTSWAFGDVMESCAYSVAVGRHFEVNL